MTTTSSMPPQEEASRAPGWYRDGAGERWWDGSGWTDQRRSWNGTGWIEQRGGTRPDAPAVPPPNATPGKSSVKGVLKWVALGFVCLIVLVAIFGEGASDPAAPESGSSANSTDASKSSDSADSNAPAANDCVNRATDDCTPKVASNRAVRVDALTWSIKGASATATLGDQQYGLGAKADDVFLVVTVRVHSNKNESATITDNAIKLEGSDGNTYSTDSEGTIAALGTGEDTLMLEDIGPDQTTTSKIVFDVPRRVLASGASLRFNELGFGSTHGYIKLPRT